MDLADYSLIRLTPDHEIKPFDCGDSDLSEFLINDAKAYLSELLAVTFIIEDDTNTVAYYSLLNDKITVNDIGDDSNWKRFRRKHPSRKRFRSYPAMKIGRLGVHNEFKGKGCGTAIIDYLKILFTNNNRTGCKYITVDAYKQSLDFYLKNGFDFLTETDKDSETRLMYFDLKKII